MDYDCQALTYWATGPCSRMATTERQGRGLCAQHAALYDGASSPEAYAASHWGWK